MRLVGGQRDLLACGTAIGRWLPDLSVDPLVEGTGFVVRGVQDDFLNVTIAAPASHVGTYSVDPLSLETGPVLLTPPVFSGSAAVGQSLAAESGLILYDPRHGIPVTTFSWVRQGATPIQSDTYTVQSGDDVFGLFLTQSVTNGAGQAEATTEVLAAPVFSGAPVYFDGNSYVTTTAPVTPSGVTDLIMFLQYDWQGIDEDHFVYSVAAGASHSYVQTGSSNGNGHQINFGYNVDPGPTWTPLTSPAGTRSTILARATLGGQMTAANRSGTSPWQVDTVASSPSSSQTSWGFNIRELDLGRNRFNPATQFEGLIHRFAIWPVSGAFDVTDPSKQSLFVNSENTLQPLALAALELGDPWFSWPPESGPMTTSDGVLGRTVTISGAPSHA